MKVRIVVLSVLMIGTVPIAAAQSQETAAMKVAQDMTAKFVPARIANDGAAIAALFTADGVFNVVPGASEAPIKGRDEIAKYMSSHPVTQFASHVRDARMVGDAIWVVGDYTATPRTGENTGKQFSGVWGDMLVRDGTDWHITMLTAYGAPTGQ
jgi:uncharacterized protein (TIGR02246 family)